MKIIERQAVAAANARGLIIVPPNNPAYLKDAPKTGGQNTTQFKDDNGVIYNIYGQVLDSSRL